jgi:hypothetical protein
MLSSGSGGGQVTGEFQHLEIQPLKREASMEVGGYLGKILRVDLSNSRTSVEELDRSYIENWV